MIRIMIANLIRGILTGAGFTLGKKGIDELSSLYKKKKDEKSDKDEDDDDEDEG